MNRSLTYIPAGIIIAGLCVLGKIIWSHLPTLLLAAYGLCCLLILLIFVATAGRDAEARRLHEHHFKRFGSDHPACDPCNGQSRCDRTLCDVPDSSDKSPPSTPTNHKP